MPDMPHPSSRRELIRALLPFAQPDTRTGVRLFVVDVLVYAVGLYLVLACQNLFVRGLGALLLGLKTSGLYTLAHDASHNTLTTSRRLNKILAVIGHLPSLMNQRLWTHDHLVMHHVKTNGPQKDIYQPLSLQQYRDASPARRAWERLVRSGSILARIPACMVESRWLVEKFFPNSRLHSEKVRREAWPLSFLLIAWLTVLVGAAVLRDPGDGAGVALTLMLLLGIPLCLFHASLGLVSYVQHTHPDVPWFAEGDPRHNEMGQEALTVHVRMPERLATLIHNGLEHGAHHVLPAIPSYRLRPAQAKLNELVGPERAVVVPMSLAAFRDIARKCKLYDYENHRWLDFAGAPTTEPLTRPLKFEN